MEDRTVLRLKLLANGYTPLLNHDKRTFLDGWQEVKVDEALIRGWDRSMHKATGIRVENGLGVFDIDVGDAARGDLVDALAQRVAAEIDKDIFSKVLVRKSTGVKEAWFARVADGEIFKHFKSRKWAHPGDDPDDPSLPKFLVEVFGGGSSRQFGSFGPHSFDDRGEVKADYTWEGPSPADMALASLPAYGKRQFARVCDIFDEICAKAGLVPIAKASTDSDPSVFYVLEPDTVVDMQDGSRLSVAELEKIAPDLHSGTEYLRCSGSFHDRSRVRTDSHAVAIGRHGIGIYDFQDGVTYCLASRKPPERYDVGEALRRLSAARLSAARGGAKADYSDEDADAKASYGEAEGEAGHGDEQAEPQAEPSPPPERRARPLSSVPVDKDSNVSHVRGVVWLVEEMAFCKSAFHGRGGVMPIYPGGDDALVVVASMKTEMRPYDRIEINSRGTVKRISPVDTWLALPEKASVAGRQLRPDMPRPLFEEAGALYVNRYAPPAHPVQGGQTKTFDIFLERLVPNQIERDWLMQWLAHKIRVPWVPMVATIMVAEDFGSGRGTLGEILALILGAQFFKECEFSMLTGSSAAARFNSMFAESLFVIVNEAAEEEGHKFSVRRTAYEVLKGVVDPNGSALRRFEAKNQDAWMQRAFMSLLIATNHPDAVKLPKGGALYRKLWALPVAASFDPYMPPTFEGKREMIDLARSSLDIAWGMAREDIRGRLFTGTQAITLMARTGMLTGHEWQKQARNLMPRWGKRLRDSAKTEVRIRFNRQREIVYAVDDAARVAFADADNTAIIKELTVTEKGLTAASADAANDAGSGTPAYVQGLGEALAKVHQTKR